LRTLAVYGQNFFQVTIRSMDWCIIAVSTHTAHVHTLISQVKNTIVWNAFFVFKIIYLSQAIFHILLINTGLFQLIRNIINDYDCSFSRTSCLNRFWIVVILTLCQSFKFIKYFMIIPTAYETLVICISVFNIL
jgi:hypothetical protein